MTTYTLSQFHDIQKLYGSGAFTISNPVSTGTGSFTFTSSNMAVATIVNNIVTLIGVGTTTITATQGSSSITATLTVIQPMYATPVLTNNANTNYQVTMNGTAYDLNQAILRNIRQTLNLNLKQGLQTIGFGSTVNVYKKNITATMNGISQVGDTQLSFGKTKKQMWVLGGTTPNSLSYSYDGISWTGLGTMLMTEVVGVVWSGTLWVAVGRKETTPYIANSYDGLNWTSKASPIFSANIHDVVWNGKLFVVVGNGTNSIGYSYNGIDWYGVARSNLDIFTSWGRDVAWNGQMWVATGVGTKPLAYSYDGIQWFSNPSTLLTNANGITYDGQKWIAVGTGTNDFIADSVDGITWVGRGKALFTSQCHGIASNGTITVAIGTGGSTICYTYGNNVWTAVSTPYLTDGRRIKWNGTMFVAVSAASPQVVYSYDGIVWNSSGTTVTGIGCCVNHNNTFEHQIVFKRRTYVAAGNPPNTLAYSYDGFSWKGLGATMFDQWSPGVATNGTVWVAVGYSNNTIAYSYDGINWTGLGKTALTGWGYAIATNGPTWLAGGSGTYQIASSTTGTSFTGVASPFSENCRGLAWNGKLWVAVGHSTQTIAWSTNGSSWTMVTNPPVSLYGFGVTWNGTMFVACGEGTNSLGWSNDGKTWNAGTTLTGENTSLLCGRFYTAKWNGNLWLAVGSAAGAALPGGMAYSYDGKQWGRVNLTLNVSAGLLWDGKKWIAGTTNQMLYSYDGFTWTNLVSIAAGSIAYDAYEPDVALYLTQPTVAVGGTGSATTKVIAYSADGMAWTNVTQTYLKQGNCVGWNGSFWIVGGIGDTYSMVYSSNGLTWSPILTSKSIFTTVNGLAYNGTMWVAGGTGAALAYSYDGMSWMSTPSPFTQVNEVMWNGTLWMAAGTGTALAYSYNGLTWTSITSTLTVGNGISYRGIARNSYNQGIADNGMWIAVGSGTDSMVYSYDGITWNGLSTIFSSATSIQNNGFLWVATGSTNAIAYSYDGFAWTGLGTTLMTTGNAVTWNGTRWIVAGTGANTLAYSVDGKTWVGLGTTALNTGNGIASQSDTLAIESKVTTDSMSFSVDVAQNGYKNLAIGVKGTLY